jgi:hypothetical protein
MSAKDMWHSFWLFSLFVTFIFLVASFPLQSIAVMLFLAMLTGAFDRFGRKL